LRLTETPNQLHPSLPPKPDFAQKADALGLGAVQQTPEEAALVSSASRALAGTARDVVANRAAIRMANMNAAEMLKAEMAGLVPVKQSKSAVRSSPSAVQPTENSEDLPSEGQASKPQDVVMTDTSDTTTAQVRSADGAFGAFTPV
jgi:5'-3' exoribonuclease 2